MKSLPKLDTPVYELILPSDEKIKLKYRPFLMKEEKILLMALESQRREDIISGVKRIVQNCILEPENFNIDDATAFDLEYIFLQIRARSVGETIEPTFRCNNMIEKTFVIDANTNLTETKTIPCGTEMKLPPINILNIKPISEPGHTKLIKLTPSIGIKMAYPKTGQLLDTFSITGKNATEISFDFLINNIEFIYDGESTFNPKDFTTEELSDFFESMNKKQAEQIEEFFTTSPKLKLDLKHKCPKCGFEHSIHMEGLESFFG
jgi:hypothetical protein